MFGAVLRRKLQAAELQPIAETVALRQNDPRSELRQPFLGPTLRLIPAQP